MKENLVAQEILAVFMSEGASFDEAHELLLEIREDIAHGIDPYEVLQEHNLSEDYLAGLLD